MFKFVSPIIQYLREVVQELRKVSWLDRKQLVAYTFVVIIGSLFVGLILGGLDFVFQQAITRFIDLTI
ncbi:MAG: preprotein translocase subunit SecE [Candidatus Terrybacteria bacterium RIFCSPLOWO2_01_FULL_44_24]|uniref:Protein translocase subunit SecE n=1 Tax=Candidatus Terrybacteria bacterium RIFCSPHIGHO2_01_FULL_43_35 TaxID=1802361 RepID=A0A1G2PD72_9BACT|nr:MAG: preprotein translocase subunit SecE [Candidatus Terrybacteria bacterium RIFCSPHIGHO2_01_FULL_43_35]OHA50203.1 MAG: preprotein translocase subunit SecE [Candidatus Terrybacteria bacterium RIFCSPHIGHO2_02_FULL_43_14]OHA51262.1 MAG: preprotein translocase subunit SecE [Candidatus Terrybacteria bacterium RIFCSPLOWO2_01_FULL_44_24]